MNLIRELRALTENEQEIWEIELTFAALDDNMNENIPEEADRQAAEFAAKYNCLSECSQRNGPSGGAAEYMFWGPEDDVKKLVMGYLEEGGMEEDFDMYWEGASESDRAWHPPGEVRKEPVSYIEILGRAINGKQFTYEDKPFKVVKVDWHGMSKAYKTSPDIEIEGDYPGGYPYGDMKFMDALRTLLPDNIQIDYSEAGMQGGPKAMDIAKLADPDSPEYAELAKRTKGKIRQRFTINVDMSVNR